MDEDLGLLRLGRTFAILFAGLSILGLLVGFAYAWTESKEFWAVPWAFVAGISGRLAWEALFSDA